MSCTMAERSRESLCCEEQTIPIIKNSIKSKAKQVFYILDDLHFCPPLALYKELDEIITMKLNIEI